MWHYLVCHKNSRIERFQMSKRAVTFSYEMIKEIITKGYMIELVECLEGIPGDAVLIEMFPDLLQVCVVLVFDSKHWEGEPTGYTRDCPINGTVPCQDVKHKKFVYKNRPSGILNVNGQRFQITSRTPVCISQDVDNDENNHIEYYMFSGVGEWIEMEKLT